MNILLKDIPPLASLFNHFLLPKISTHLSFTRTTKAERMRLTESDKEEEQEEKRGKRSRRNIDN